jgi:hypothetical protein
MNVLLIYPDSPDTFWGFKHALKFIRKRAYSPPLGLLTVAAMLPPGWSKRLIDVGVTKLRKKDLEWADCALVSGMTIQRESARRIIARCSEPVSRCMEASSWVSTTIHPAFSSDRLTSSRKAGS